MKPEEIRELATLLENRYNFWKAHSYADEDDENDRKAAKALYAMADQQEELERLRAENERLNARLKLSNDALAWYVDNYDEGSLAKSVIKTQNQCDPLSTDDTP